MQQPDPSVEVFLHQGEVYFGDRNTRIRTVLGSCVAITVWHPDLLIGGMCHYMLPSRRERGQKLHSRVKKSPIGFLSRRTGAQKPLDGKYADEALELMFSEIQRSGTRAAEYQVKLFGGGNMFPRASKLREQHVGLKNVEAGRELLARHGMKISAEHLGGIGHRNLIFDIGRGDVWMRHQTLTPSPCESCQGREICLHA